MISTFSFPNTIVFGHGSLSRLPDLLSDREYRSVLLVTDGGLVRAGIAERVLNLLADAFETTCFDQVSPNPDEACLEKAAHALRDARADVVIGLGGGSAMDTAKAACLRLRHREPLSTYELRNDGARFVVQDVPPNVAIPTTAGTGSEVGRSAVITLGGRKAILNSPRMLPELAICDPELTVGLPPDVTAATGLDALTHNLEAYLSVTCHPVCDAIALGGIRLVAGSLLTAVKTGADIRARSDMMMAAAMGAIAFQKDLGVAHALAHPLSALAGLPHGLANAIMLPHTMRFNRQVAQERLRHVASALGCEIAGLTVEAAAGRAIEAVEVLLHETGLPRRLGDVGVSADMVPELAARALEDPNHLTNPRPCKRTDMDALYRAAL